MKDAIFEHKKTGQLYTVVVKAKTSLPPGFALVDLESVGVRKTDHGYIAVVTPNLGVDYSATMQTAAPVVDGVDCVLYRGDDNRLWLRPTAEFTDGRFEPRDPRAACMMPATYHLGLM